MKQVNLKKWRVLSIPVRDTEKRIYFSTFDDDEYRLLISMHKKYTTKDCVELALDKISSDQHKQNIDIIMDSFQTEKDLTTNQKVL